ncbi:tRNA pseudouridine(55) synthase TruB [Aeoliella mucimassa]|uniref:tRNA pseudouridine synthase B n=1 Tax=Aeoliella mucimassa TaxID=2527972 RepID=A0A518ARQ9_9BACT|nr:tRNA pseudouridine(55) synthase TruB [Aeoliella mucimassa]QDU57419.1 tRNA pseudouridine synthase B [Aeoliella mucimassa]
MFGIINVNKPAGWTSRDVVNRVQRLVRPAKAGHAGTLDPLATGVLLVCVGPATRLIDHLQQMPKRYVGTFRMGVTSPSDDTELELTPVPNAAVPELADIEAKLPEFTGDILQRPPAYSAIKIKGRKAYDLAREGKAVDLAPRPVTIYSVRVVRYEHPELVLDIECGSGTYIRSLGRDLAEALGTGAVMSALERTAIGEFQVAESCTPDEIKEQGPEPFLQSAVGAVAKLPRIELTPADVETIHHGRSIHRDGSEHPEWAAIDPNGQLVALLVPRGNGALGPRMVFKPKR